MEWKIGDDGQIIVFPFAGYALLKVQTGEVLLAVDYVPDEAALETGARERLQLALTARQAVELGQQLIGAGQKAWQPPMDRGSKPQ